MKSQKIEKDKQRILGRRLAKELNAEDMKSVLGAASAIGIGGGTTSCSPCADDCDQENVF